MNKNPIISGMALAFIVGAVLGYIGAGYQYSAQLDKAKKAFPVITDVRSISGTVKSVSGNTITVETAPSNNPFDEMPTVREINVTTGTKIVRNEQVDPAVFQKEMLDFQAAMQKQRPRAQLPAAPMPFTEKDIKVSDLKAGDMVMVQAASNIKTATSFDAVKISVTGTAPAGANNVLPAPSGPPAGATAPIVNTPQVRTSGGVPPQ